MAKILLPELSTRSVFDVVNENFAKTGLKSFACRIIYSGDHSLATEHIVEFFRKTIHDVNAFYCDIQLSGLLLAYEGYFMHVLEGSEDTIHRQLRFLLQNAEQYENDQHSVSEDKAEENKANNELTAETDKVNVFKRLKLLIVYHSIKKKTLTGWGAVTATPPTLVTKLDPYGHMDYHIEQLKACVDKINGLCTMYIEDQELSFTGMSAADPKMQYIPEFVLLELLLDSKHVIDLRKFVAQHRRVDEHTFYFEQVWPQPTHFTPRHLYKLKVDDEFVEPLPIQEWQKKSTEPETEGDSERPSASSSSEESSD